MSYQHEKKLEWFDDNKYREAAKLGPRGWFELLLMRSMYIKGGVPHELLIKLFNNPLDYFYYPSNNPEYNKNHPVVTSIAPKDDLIRIEFARDFPEQSDELNILLGYAKINVYAPKDQIIKDFKKWLDKQRNEVQASKRSFEVIRNNFIQSKVLQYLDLIIYFQNEGYEPTQTEIAQILYPQENIGPEKIRQTTIHNAKKAISDPYLNWLDYLAKEVQR